ncbi:MAG: hypothetical protein WCW02_00320 [Candidatus Buchananbacteria bacterium]
MGEKVYQWFIVIASPEVNNSLAAYFASKGEMVERENYELYIPKEDRKVQAWEVEYPTVGLLLKNKTFQLDRDYKIYNRCGRNGQVRKWLFAKKRTTVAVKNKLAAMRQPKKPLSCGSNPTRVAAVFSK